MAVEAALAVAAAQQQQQQQPAYLTAARLNQQPVGVIKLKLTVNLKWAAQEVKYDFHKTEFTGKSTIQFDYPP